jgi:transposase
MSGKKAISDTVILSQQEYQNLKKIASDYDHLKAQLAELRRMIFGVKSERFISETSTDQLSLFGSDEKPQEQTDVEQQVSYTRKKPKEKKQPLRAALPAHLPRKEEVIEPDDLSPDAKKIGEEVTELLEYTPGSMYVRKIIRPKYAAPTPTKDQNEDTAQATTTKPIIIADLPSIPILRGNAGASLLAHIQVSKWIDHLPYYRQIQIYKRGGVIISSSTINDWFNATCSLLESLYNVLKEKIRGQTYLQADESTIRVQDSHKKGSTHLGYHWVYHAPEIKAVCFDYQTGRSKAGPQAFLENWSGTLQSDGYTVYDSLQLENPITQLACMAHARRKFDQALDNDRDRATYALTQIQKLYALERKCREKAVDPATKQRYRQLYATPILDSFGTWLEAEYLKVSAKSKIGTAMAYTMRLYKKLRAYTQEGRYHIDNNAIENTIRPLALGRKNYLFAGSHKAAQNAAMMYSLLGTCKLNGIEPYQWLVNTLNKIPDTKISELYTLLPIAENP